MIIEILQRGDKKAERMNERNIIELEKEIEKKRNLESNLISLSLQEKAKKKYKISGNRR